MPIQHCTTRTWSISSYALASLSQPLRDIGLRLSLNKLPCAGWQNDRELNPRPFHCHHHHMSFRSTGSCSRLEVKVIAAAYKYQKIDRGVLAIRCVRRANSARGPFAVGAQTNPVRGRGPFWNFCTRARSNLATQLKIELSVSSQLRLHAPSLDLFLGYIYVIIFQWHTYHEQWPV